MQRTKISIDAGLIDTFVSIRASLEVVGIQSFVPRDVGGPLVPTLSHVVLEMFKCGIVQVTQRFANFV